MDELTVERVPWYRRPLFLTILAGLALLFLASAVYTVALQARQLSQAAQEAHGLNETLRIASGVRNQLALTDTYRAIGGTGVNTTQALDVSIQSASIGLDNLQDALENEDVAEFAEVSDAGLNYVQLARDHIAAIKAAPDPSVLLPSEAAANIAFDRAADALEVNRVNTLTQMEDINENMNDVGSTAGFGVAFVVPAIALYVFEALRRTRLRVRLAESDLRALKTQQRNRATKDAAALRDIDSSIRALRSDPSVAAAGPSGATRLASLESDVSQVLNRSLASGALATTSTLPVDLEQLLSTAAARSGVDPDISLAMRNPIVETDAGHLERIVMELLRNARLHGGSDIDLSAHHWSDSVAITVMDNGGGLPDEVHQAVFLDNNLALRRRLASGEFGHGLLAVRSLAEAMGAEFRYDRTGDLTHFTVQIPVRSATEAGRQPMPDAELRAH